MNRSVDLETAREIHQGKTLLHYKDKHSYLGSVDMENYLEEIIACLK